MAISEFKLATLFGTLTCGACKSSCCDDEPTEQQLEDQRIEHEQAKKMKEIEVVMRVMRDATDHLLRKAVEQILAETGEVPSIDVLPQGVQSPEPNRRQLTVRIQDIMPEHAPEQDAASPQASVWDIPVGSAPAAAAPNPK